MGGWGAGGNAVGACGSGGGREARHSLGDQTRARHKLHDEVDVSFVADEAAAEDAPERAQLRRPPDLWEGV